jgi:hypothetical protein
VAAGSDIMFDTFICGGVQQGKKTFVVKNHFEWGDFLDIDKLFAYPINKVGGISVIYSHVGHLRVKIHQNNSVDFTTHCSVEHTKHFHSKTIVK